MIKLGMGESYVDVRIKMLLLLLVMLCDTFAKNANRKGTTRLSCTFGGYKLRDCETCV